MARAATMAGEDERTGRARSRAESVDQAKADAAVDLLRAGGVSRVSGESMVPTLPASSWVRFSARKPRPGDVVVYRRALGDLVVHRFLGRRPSWWGRSSTHRDDPWIVTKPDATPEFDVEVRESAVLGVVEEMRPDPSSPWRELTVTRSRRWRSTLWFARYALGRGLRRLAR